MKAEGIGLGRGQAGVAEVESLAFATGYSQQGRVAAEDLGMPVEAVAVDRGEVVEPEVGVVAGVERRRIDHYKQDLKPLAVAEVV